MGICPLYSSEKKGCILKRDWGLCTEKSSDQYRYYWRECGRYLQEKENRANRIDKEGQMSKYINFVEVFGDTIVMSTRQKEPLAKIIYYPYWKQYVLEPLPESIFNDECLVDIIAQIKLLNKNRAKGGQIK